MSNETNNPATVQVIAYLGSVNALVSLVTSRDEAKRIKASILDIAKKINDKHGFANSNQQTRNNILTEPPKTVK